MSDTARDDYQTIEPASTEGPEELFRPEPSHGQATADQSSTTPIQALFSSGHLAEGLSIEELEVFPSKRLITTELKSVTRPSLSVSVFYPAA